MAFLCSNFHMVSKQVRLSYILSFVVTLQCSLLGYDISMISMHTCNNSSKFVKDITTLNLNGFAKENFLQCVPQINSFCNYRLVIRQTFRDLLGVVRHYIDMFTQLDPSYIHGYFLSFVLFIALFCGGVLELTFP